jgi:hypothetical protein
MYRPATLALIAAVLMSGCEMFGMESAEKIAAAREAEGRAIGGACRHAGRAIEDCYALNKRADKGSIFAGWREMNDYMRENQIEEVSPQVAHPPAEKVAARREADEPAAASAKH